MGMVLLTKDDEANLPNLYATEEIPTEDKMAVVKFFTTGSSWTWYAVEYDPDNKEFFGWVDGPEPELGYFSLQVFESYNQGKPRFPVERDLYFKPTKLKEIMTKAS